MKKKIFHGIVSDVVWEPKETGNIIFEEKKKQTWLCFRAKRQKKTGKRHFSQKFAYFCNFGGKNKSNEKKKHF